MKIDFKKNPEIMELISKAPLYRKMEKTFFRKPKDSEIGQMLVTYVANPSGVGYRKEAEIIIDGSRAIARNNLILELNDGIPLYNEWTKPYSEIKEAYGQECIDSLTDEYQKFSQIKPIRLLKLTPQVMEVLGLKDQEVLLIDVAWSESPMIAVIGDFITANGYSISQVDVQMQYKKIEG